jgi:hypothetical protein
MYTQGGKHTGNLTWITDRRKLSILRLFKGQFTLKGFTRMILLSFQISVSVNVQVLNVLFR